MKGDPWKIKGQFISGSMGIEEVQEALVAEGYCDTKFEAMEVVDNWLAEDESDW